MDKKLISDGRMPLTNCGWIHPQNVNYDKGNVLYSYNWRPGAPPSVETQVLVLMKMIATKHAEEPQVGQPQFLYRIP